MNETIDSSGLNSTGEAIIAVRTFEQFIAVMDYNVPMAMFINRYLTPVWYVVGGIGNIIAARIWLHPRMKACNISANYLAALSLSDLTYLCLHVFYELENPWLVRTLGVTIWCEVWNVLYMAVQYLCVMLVCAFTVERFLSVCHPFKSERFCRKSRSVKVILILLFVAFVFGLPQAYFWEVRDVNNECVVRAAERIPDANTFYYVYTWCSEIIMFLLVPLIVLWLNTCVLMKIKTVGKLNANDSRVNHIKYNLVATTVTLLWVSCYLIVTTIPVTITFAIQNSMILGPSMPLSKMGQNATWSKYFNYYSARAIIKEICMSHHVCNIFIYCTTSRRFLKHLRETMIGHIICYSGEESTSAHQYPTPLLKNRHLVVNRGSRSRSDSRS